MGRDFDCFLNDSHEWEISQNCFVTDKIWIMIILIMIQIWLVQQMAHIKDIDVWSLSIWKMTQNYMDLELNRLSDDQNLSK